MHLRILMVLGSPASEKSVWFRCSQSVSWHLVSILYETFYTIYSYPTGPECIRGQMLFDVPTRYDSRLTI